MRTIPRARGEIHRNSLRRLARVALRRLVGSRLGSTIEAGACNLGRHWGKSRLGRAIPAHVLGAILANEPGATRLAYLPHAGKLLCPLDDWLGASLYFFGNYEPETTALFRRQLRPGDVVVDVGANLGYFTILAASLVGNSGSVHSFEPNPRLTPFLLRSIELNHFERFVHLTNAAIAEQSGGLAALHLSTVAASSGVSSLLPLSHLAAGLTIEVPLLSLADYCGTRQISNIRLLKVDVEGAELQVIRGMRELLLARRVELLVCEVQPNERDRDAPKHLIEELDAFGYSPFAISKRGGLQPVQGGSIGRPGLNLCFSPHALLDHQRAWSGTRPEDD
jgi:FkbM family methyltransferase